jgi:hypothetical protein
MRFVGCAAQLAKASLDRHQIYARFVLICGKDSMLLQVLSCVQYCCSTDVIIQVYDESAFITRIPENHERRQLTDIIPCSYFSYLTYLFHGSLHVFPALPEWSFPVCNSTIVVLYSHLAIFNTSVVARKFLERSLSEQSLVSNV